MIYKTSSSAQKIYIFLLKHSKNPIFTTNKTSLLSLSWKYCVAQTKLKRIEPPNMQFPEHRNQQEKTHGFHPSK